MGQRGRQGDRERGANQLLDEYNSLISTFNNVTDVCQAEPDLQPYLDDFLGMFYTATTGHRLDSSTEN